MKLTSEMEKELLAMNLLKAMEKDEDKKRIYQEQINNWLQVAMIRKEKIDELTKKY